MGIKTTGILPAFFMPLFLTMILFLGPLATKGFTGLLKLYIGNPPHQIFLQNSRKTNFQSHTTGKTTCRTLNGWECTSSRPCRKSLLSDLACCRCCCSVSPRWLQFLFAPCFLVLVREGKKKVGVSVIARFFSAHFHHMFERLRLGYDYKTALLVSCKFLF